MPSDAFERFRSSFEVMGPQWRDDYDVDALLELETDERQTAIDWLFDRVDRGEDPRAARALVALAPLDGLQERLAAALSNAIDDARIETALALYRLTGDSSYAGEVATVLSSDAPYYTRNRAAVALRRFPASRRTGSALLAALDDEDKLVRQNAVATLYEHLDLAAYDQPAGRLGVLKARFGLPFPSVRARARQELEDLIEALGQGRSPGELGLSKAMTPPSEAFKSISASARELRRDPEASLDLGTLDELSPAERARVDFLLLHLLARGDTRAPAALLAAGTPGARTTLGETMATVDEPLEKAIVKALSDDVYD